VNRWVQQTAVNFLFSWTTVSSWRRTVLRVVS
jgi:hypothetical protein